MNPQFSHPHNLAMPIIALESIQIASPCHADWDKMHGDAQVRHCQSCAKNVYNLSAMTRDAAQRLIIEKEGNLCVQLHRRSDGTVITSDCTVGISGRKKSLRDAPKMIAAVFAAILGIFGVQTGRAAQNGGAAPSSGVHIEMGEAPAQMMTGRVATVRGKIAMPTPTAIPQTKVSAKTVKMPAKNHGNNSARKDSARKNARRASNALQHRRHR